MKKDQFLKEISEHLELDFVLESDTKFQEIDEWDSMGVIILIGYISEHFNVVITANDLKSLPTFDAIFFKIGKEKFED
jgi:acyl carrier protein